MDLLKHIETEILLRNNTPVSDFENLSPTNFHHILYDYYSDKSPVRFHQNIGNETLDKIPLFRVVEDYIRIIEREKFIKLTPLGALPRKVMVELYDKKYIYDFFIENGITKLSREIDCVAIMNARLVAELAGITQRANGKMTLTQKGTDFLNPENRLAFFKLFFSTFTDKFNWCYNDRYPQKPIGQFGWSFTIYLLAKYGKEYRLDSFYAKKYLTALPHMLEYFRDIQFGSVEQQFEYCYSGRTFYRFLFWFGIVETKEKEVIVPEKNIKATEILTDLFNIDL